MKLLAIECTAHTLGASVVEKQGAGAVSRRNTSILSNEVDKYPAKIEGFIPRKLADHHAAVFGKVVSRALASSGSRVEEMDAIAYSYGPGIGACLHSGFVGAHALSLLLGKPLVPVNHTVAHAEVGRWWFGFADPLVVYVSGGNTQLAALQVRGGRKAYHVLGETLDIGVGNFLDVLGRTLELTPPDAVGVIAQAKIARGESLIDLPYTVKGMDLAFSGLLTACERAHKAGAPVEELCFSAQETAFAMLVEACERALCHARKKEVLLVGGVAQNPRVQEMVSAMAKPHGVKVGIVPPPIAGDNAGMIGVTALMMLNGRAKLPPSHPQPDIRLDSTPVEW